ncbi:MAG: hypothetical protein ACMUJM_26155 [bacterium]
MNPRAILKDGADILGEYLYPIGFHFEVINEGKGSGGNFVTGEFKKGEIKLELHFRYSLGMVRYHYKEKSVSHKNYMKALGVIDRCQYPGSSNDPLDGFRHLKHDIAKFGSDFTDGDHFVLLRAAREEQAHEAEIAKVRSAAAEGDDIKRANGKRYFTQKQYQKCITELESVHYPELLSSSERKMLEISKRKLKST